MHVSTMPLLSRVLDAAELTLKRPAWGDERRVKAIEQLLEDLATQAAMPSENGESFVNDWTIMLVKALRLLECAAPYSSDARRALKLAEALMPFVREDTRAALDRARPSTTDQDPPR